MHDNLRVLLVSVFSSTNLIGKKWNFVEILRRILLLWTHERHVLLAGHDNKVLVGEEHVSESINKDLSENGNKKHFMNKHYKSFLKILLTTYKYSFFHIENWYPF